MKKPAIFIAVPFDSDNLIQVEYLQHKGDPHPSTCKKGDIISVDQWWKEHESKEKYWKEWWQPIKFSLTNENGKTIDTPEEIKLSIKEIKSILDNGGRCSVEWEENQCDGCKARIPLEGGNHKKPNDPTDPFGIGCTAYRYDRPKLTEAKIVIHI